MELAGYTKGFELELELELSYITENHTQLEHILYLLSAIERIAPSIMMHSTEIVSRKDSMNITLVYLQDELHFPKAISLPTQQIVIVYRTSLFILWQFNFWISFVRVFVIICNP